MKQISKIILTVFCLAAVSFYGCKKDDSKADEAKNIAKIPISNAAVEFAYKQVKSLYEDIEYGALPLQGNNTVVEDEDNWYKVKDNIGTFAKLESYLKNFLSDQLTGELMDKVHKNTWVKEIGGQLYTRVNEINSLIAYNETACTYTKVNDYKIIMHVKVQIISYTDAQPPSEYEIFDHIYENLDGAKWVFTSFPSFHSYTYSKIFSE